MKRVTRNIDLTTAQDLLERVPRACLCYAGEDGPQAQPIRLLWHDNRYLIGFPTHISRPALDQEAVLLIDEGVHYFDLRALYIRGKVRASAAPPQAAADKLAWLEIIPLKVVAWDYGAFHEVQDEQR